jgi:dihydroorotate dehydrogenase electron transfer subunit
MKKYMHDFRIQQNRRLSANYFVLNLESSEKLPEILPGQFAEVLVTNSSSTYLRRPFSIYDVDYEKNTIRMLIKSIGTGTAKLYDLVEGDSINIIYPLGNSFSLPEGKNALLIGGGVGIAPMLYLSKFLKSQGFEIDVLIGGRTQNDILEPELYSSYANVYITTDDGSVGERGMVTEHSLFSNGKISYSKVYACGPDPMMKAVAKLAYSKSIPCEVSLENMMACGIGACLCCVVETHQGNKTTCVDGPVFDSRELAGWH